MRCEFPVTFGTCPQKTWADRKHRFYRPFCYYHDKLTGDLLQPVRSYLSESEISAMMSGRRHDDGRRLDAYVLEERRRRKAA